MAAKRKWSMEEETALADYFHDCKKRCEKPKKEKAQEILRSKGFGDIDASKVGAKLSDLWKIDRNEDLAHVADATIKAYHNAFLNDPNELLTLLAKLRTETGTKLTLTPIVRAYIAQSQMSADTGVLIGAKTSRETFEDKMERIIDDIRWNSKFKTTWSQIYFYAGVNPTTANYIRKGQRLEGNYENLYRLFIQMKLTLAVAMELMEAAGLSFRKDNMIDAIVMLALERGIYDHNAINDALVRTCDEILFPREYNEHAEPEA